MDKDKPREMVDGIWALAEIMALTYKTMIKAGLDTGEAKEDNNIELICSLIWMFSSGVSFCNWLLDLAAK